MDTSSAATLDEVIRSGLLGQETALGSIGHAFDEYFSTDDTRTRSALMNFAVFGDRPEGLPSQDSQLQSITRDHACRGLLISASQADAPPSARAWIKGQCHLDGTGGKFRCSEQISLLAQGENEGFLTNLIFSNLRSDLPLVIWWQANLRPHFQERLYSRIDRLILDSSQWTRPQEEFQVLMEALNARSTRFSHMQQQARLLLHDLAYTRGHGQRRAIAHLFDDPVAQAQIPHLHRALIQYRTGHLHTALYLAAWISRQLDADSPAFVTPDLLRYQRPSFPLEIELRENPSPDCALLPLLTLSSPEACFSVLPSAQGAHLQAQTECGHLHKEHLLPPAVETDEALVSEILMRSGKNMLLGHLLPRFLELLTLRGALDTTGPA